MSKQTCIVTLKITYDPDTEGSPDGWDWDALLESKGVEIVSYSEDE